MSFFTSEPEVDAPLLRKAVDWVRYQATLPGSQREWNQLYWRVESGNDCGTTFCVAGYVCEVSGVAWERERGGASIVTPSGSTVSVQDEACRLLGLTLDEAIVLFAASNSADDVVKTAEWIMKRTGEKL